MSVTVSLFLLVTVIIAVLLGVKRLRVGAFLLCAIWGFLLAGTSFSPAVRQFIRNVARLLGAP
jgi:hypothetical protein